MLYCIILYNLKGFSIISIKLDFNFITDSIENDIIPEGIFIPSPQELIQT